jgi:hypothetical protein
MSFSISLHRISPIARLGGGHRTAEPLPPLARKERILAHRESRTGSVMATDRALMLRERDGTWRRIAWTAISSAAWSHVDHCLTLRLWSTGHDSHQQVRVAADNRFAAVVCERVEFQRLLCVPVELPGDITG